MYTYTIYKISGLIILPPFYHSNTDRRHHKICMYKSEHIQTFKQILLPGPWVDVDQKLKIYDIGKIPIHYFI